jgi:hypothetical protein
MLNQFIISVFFTSSSRRSMTCGYENPIFQVAYGSHLSQGAGDTINVKDSFLGGKQL